jgi:hypothetical protein
MTRFKNKVIYRLKITHCFCVSVALIFATEALKPACSPSRSFGDDEQAGTEMKATNKLL